MLLIYIFSYNILYIDFIMIVCANAYYYEIYDLYQGYKTSFNGEDGNGYHNGTRALLLRS
jgi:hypothetical protein